MSKKLNTRYNPKSHALFTSLAGEIKTKRQRAVLKQLLKQADLSVFPALAGALLPYCQATNKSAVNIILWNVQSHDLLDYGRWLVLLPLMCGQPELQVNALIVPAKGQENTDTQYRKLVDFLCDTVYPGQITTRLVRATLVELVDDSDDNTIDVIFNNNPDIADFDLDELESLATLINQGVQYVIGDISPLSLYTRVLMMNMLGLTTDQVVRDNPYFLPLQQGISARHKHLGYTVAFNQAHDISLLSPAEHQQFKAMASRIIELINLSDPLFTLPAQDEHGVWQVLSQLRYDPVTHKATSTYTGDTVTITLPAMPPPGLSNTTATPACTKTMTLDDKVALTAWALRIYDVFSVAYANRSGGMPQDERALA